MTIRRDSPFLFGLVVGATGSYRQAILSLIVLFIAGIAANARGANGLAEAVRPCSR